MKKGITKKYGFGVYVQDMLGVNHWVSKSDYDKILKRIHHQYEQSQYSMDSEFRAERSEEVRYDGDTYSEKVIQYRLGTTDIEFVVRETKEGYYFKSRK